MAKKKQSITYFPQDYSTYKLIKKFRKSRSPRTRIFITNDPAQWLIDVMEIKTRTGEVVNNEGWITEKQIDDWSNWYKNLGWEECSISE